jgi:hypothetical protein
MRMCEPKDVGDEGVSVWINHKSLEEGGDLIEDVRGSSYSLPASRLRCRPGC